MTSKDKDLSKELHKTIIDAGIPNAHRRLTFNCQDEQIKTMIIQLQKHSKSNSKLPHQIQQYINSYNSSQNQLSNQATLGYHTARNGSKIKRTIRFEDQGLEVTAEDIHLEEGLGDLKVPYHPDFGYTQWVELEERRPTWNMLADQILKIPQHKSIQRLIEYKLTQSKQNSKDMEKNPSSITLGGNGSTINRMRTSIIKIINQKRQEVSNQPLEAFKQKLQQSGQNPLHKRMISLDSKYSKLKNDCTLVSSSTEKFQEYLQKIKHQTAQQSRKNSNENQLNNSQSLVPVNRSFGDFNDSFQKSFDLSNQKRVPPNQLAEIKEKKSLLNKKRQEILSQQQNSINHHPTLTVSPRDNQYKYSNLFSIQNEYCQKKIDMLDQQINTIENKYDSSDRGYIKIKKDFNDWIKAQSKNQQPLDYLEFMDIQHKKKKKKNTLNDKMSRVAGNINLSVDLSKTDHKFKLDMNSIHNQSVYISESGKASKLSKKSTTESQKKKKRIKSISTKASLHNTYFRVKDAQDIYNKQNVIN